MDMGQTLRLRVSSAGNEREEEFRLPAGWAATVFAPRDRSAMTDADIRKALAKPLGTKPIAQAARGARKAVLLVDDFRRPTPAETLCLAVIDELEAAGLQRDQIIIVLGSGAHRKMNLKESRKRLGTAYDRVGKVLSHDAFSDRVKFMGITPAGTPVLVNEEAAEADFSVSISCVYPHRLVGWGGGAKMVLPGIAHVSTIHCHHSRIHGATWACAPGDSPSRRDLEAAAKLFDLNVSLCAVVNSRREMCGLGVGEPNKAHRSAVALARKVGDTPMTEASPDLIIANAYPFDADGTQYTKAQAPALEFNCPMLLLNDFADPSIYHGLYHGPLDAWKKREQPAPPEHTEELLMNARVFFYSPQYARGFMPPDRSWYCDNDWPRLMEAMSRRFINPKVAVFPAAPLQLPRIV